MKVTSTAVGANVADERGWSRAAAILIRPFDEWAAPTFFVPGRWLRQRFRSRDDFTLSQDISISIVSVVRRWRKEPQSRSGALVLRDPRCPVAKPRSHDERKRDDKACFECRKKSDDKTVGRELRNAQMLDYSGTGVKKLKEYVSIIIR